MPKIEVVSQPQVTIAGLHYHGKNQGGEVPQLWMQLNQHWDEIQGKDESAHKAYGVSIMGDDFGETMTFDYIAGFPLLDAETSQPEGIVTRTIPAGLYAVIVSPNLASIQQAYDAVYNRWLPESGYVLDLSQGNFCFELYGEEFMPAAGSEKFFIYVPVKEK